MAESSNATTSEAPSTSVAAADARYTFDSDKLEELRKSSPWKDDPRYFKGVAVSPSAVMKMVSLGSWYHVALRDMILWRYISAVHTGCIIL